MRTIPKPTFTTEEVLITCISNYMDNELVSRFINSKDEITDWSKLLEENIESNSAYTIQEDCKPTNISKREMIKLYTDKFSKQKQPGRVYYDAIMDLPKHNLCPLCGYRPVDSLDHYMPKEKFPAFSISPINLIPACMGCNKAKNSSKPTKAEEEFINPYFDNIENELWLYSELNEELPLTIFFSVRPHESWNEIKKERVKRHFIRFKLGQLYSSYASNEISGKIYLLKKTFELGGAPLVRNELIKECESLRYDQLNSWKTALYAALVDSEWFCQEALSYSTEELLK